MKRRNFLALFGGLLGATTLMSACRGRRPPRPHDRRDDRRPPESPRQGAPQGPGAPGGHRP